MENETIGERDSDCLRVTFEEKGIKLVVDFEPGIIHEEIKRICYIMLNKKINKK